MCQFLISYHELLCPNVAFAVLLNETKLNYYFVSPILQMVQAIQVLRFHLLELEKVTQFSLSLSFFLFFSYTEKEITCYWTLMSHKKNFFFE